jgi:hypothetical protein
MDLTLAGSEGKAALHLDEVSGAVQQWQASLELKQEPLSASGDSNLFHGCFCSCSCLCF